MAMAQPDVWEKAAHAKVVNPDLLLFVFIYIRSRIPDASLLTMGCSKGGWITA